jgi:ABC-type uncharacterized transport system substrate-binding protein
MFLKKSLPQVFGLIKTMSIGFSMSSSFKGTLLLWMGLWMGQMVCGQSLDVPVEVQVPLFLKATSYDRTFASKLNQNGVLHIAICYQAKNRISVQEMEALKQELSKPSNGFKIQLTIMDIGDGTQIAARKEWESLSAIYITSMRGVDLMALLREARNHKVMSVCTDAGLATKGVSVGFELVDSRPKFVINRDSAASEGCDFSSQLLKLATIY